MFIIADILLFLTTSLVLSITALCLLTYIRAKDNYSLNFLSILIPLAAQMLLTQFYTYIHRLFPDLLKSNTNYKLFAIWATCISIILTTLLLYALANFLIKLLPLTKEKNNTALILMRLVILLFFIISIVIILLFSDLDIITAMKITFNYHFFAGSYLMVILGVFAFYYKKFVKGWEKENLLSGMVATFFPLIITFPIDLIFFRENTFKLAYLSYSCFSVYLYFYISRQYFQKYEKPIENKVVNTEYLKEAGISTREKEVLLLLFEGKTSYEIASELFISNNTVKSHIKHIYKKLNVSTRVQLFVLLSNKKY
ncbi:MAG: helix-turn-helix domain-containing protein [Pleomorphochaeta sp.]